MKARELRRYVLMLVSAVSLIIISGAMLEFLAPHIYEDIISNS